MARLGEHLISAQLISADQVDQALRAQVVWGGRLGTNLVEASGLDLDDLSRVLGQQHGCPAALDRHFEKADEGLQADLPHEIAKAYCVIPLVRLSRERVAVVAIDPLRKEALEALADVYGVDPKDGILYSVAAEMRVLYHLERIYKIPRTSRYLRARGETAPSLGEIDISFELDDSGIGVQEIETKPTGRVELPPEQGGADDIAAMIDLAMESSPAPVTDGEPVGRDRRRYVRTLGEEALGRIAIKKLAITTGSIPKILDDGAIKPPTFAEAKKAIKRGPNRDRVAELTIETLEQHVPTCEAALLLVVRGNVAIGWKHFARGRDSAPEVAVPLDQAGIVPAVIERQQIGKCAAEDLGEIDRLLFDEIGGTGGELVVAPVMIGTRVMCLISAILQDSSEVQSVDDIAGAASAAFVRLIRDLSR